MRREKAFTLIELLLVIVVMGILAAMMMFSSGEAADMARATKIINDLQIIKRAALAYYADHEEEFRTTFNKTANYNDIKNYLGNNNDPDLRAHPNNNYGIATFKSDTYSISGWFVYYKGSLLKNRPGIRRRLEERAKSQGLWRNGTDTHFGKSGDNWTLNKVNDKEFIEANIYKANDGENSYVVALRIR